MREFTLIMFDAQMQPGLLETSSRNQQSTVDIWQPHVQKVQEKIQPTVATYRSMPRGS